MTIPKVWIRLSVVAGVLMAIVSAAGAFFPHTYFLESLSWGTQGAAQDLVNLFVAVPVLFLSAYFLNKGSIRALLIWLGVLLYVVYSYVIYAFFLHFGPWFLVYVATLGFSFYALAGGFASFDWKALAAKFSDAKTGPVSIFLGVMAGMFAVLWIYDIIHAIFNNMLPSGVADAGLWINPVHVLDLAFFLPATALAAWQLRKKETLGLVLAVPILIFLALVSLAMVAMVVALANQGFPVSVPMMVIILLSILIGLTLINQFLGEIDRKNEK
jgi:hypothetical protein